ncbi:ribonuclease III [Thermanaerothrix sp.]|uniref:ribonuclease III n=1 Tax=Thermanaerothrix sp. TaxID=2972675 RepID=UPI002ADDFBB4|nr:ribonuclease III [Thermanaerothrix sp.]
MGSEIPVEKVESPQELANRLGLKFKDWLLLSRALTHRSYLNEHPEAIEDNERLEFLGDAVLDFLVAVWLYHRYPEMPEGDLTRMRSALVHTEQLAEFARRIGLGRALRLGRGEAQAGGRDRPSLLCDTFEALIGAIYLDQGLEAVEAFLIPFLEEAAEDVLLHYRVEDPKSLLQEWAQSQGLAAPRYITRNVYGPEHAKVFEVEVLINGKVCGWGSGSSKHAATKSAARDAIRRLGIVPETML